MQSAPARATQLLTLLSTGYTPQPADGDDAAPPRPGGAARCDPEQLIHCFVEQPEALEKFLSGVLAQREELSEVPWNTLLELLLRRLADIRDGVQEGGEEEAAALEGQIMEVLEQPHANYDDVYALCLAQMHQFRPGQLFLYRKLHMYHMVLELYMEDNDNYQLLQLCKQYGDNDPNLWIQVRVHCFVVQGG